MKVVYHPRYNISLLGIERFHPFDSCKYGRAWKEIKRTNRDTLRNSHLRVDRAVTEDELLMVHRQSHLDSLRRSSCIAAGGTRTREGRHPRVNPTPARRCEATRTGAVSNWATAAVLFAHSNF